ncbi:hypothetical protein CBM2592_A90033 [Cupriavidus taiwanensis]|nr:hypothetical protein CBM2588_A60031 [Cupriavidus taiwanensis]SOY56718.1 hypothetical protein CBM2592_A90033 [Cupriavidus taiwanensis]SOY90639.1 hypothetical protein CBM2591_A90032 [Cupriavidus taiwanensis]SOZ63394.1 hypothetical protein CBM2617_A70006 [Cupriavidus taiwanensis]SOZ82402.1 hypothetical protein CBM2618_A80006 [Cupriavidus taiwanensis]
MPSNCWPTAASTPAWDPPRGAKCATNWRRGSGRTCRCGRCSPRWRASMACWPRTSRRTAGITRTSWTIGRCFSRVAPLPCLFAVALWHPDISRHAHQCLSSFHWRNILLPDMAPVARGLPLMDSCNKASEAERQASAYKGKPCRNTKHTRISAALASRPK